MSHNAFDTMFLKETEKLFYHNLAISKARKDARNRIDHCIVVCNDLSETINTYFSEWGYQHVIDSLMRQVEEVREQFRKDPRIQQLKTLKQEHEQEIENLQETLKEISYQETFQDPTYIREWLGIIRAKFLELCSFLPVERFYQIWDAATAHIDLSKKVREKDVSLVQHRFLALLQGYVSLNLVQLPETTTEDKSTDE